MHFLFGVPVATECNKSLCEHAGVAGGRCVEHAVLSPAPRSRPWAAFPLDPGHVLTLQVFHSAREMTLACVNDAIIDAAAGQLMCAGRETPERLERKAWSRRRPSVTVETRGLCLSRPDLLQTRASGHRGSGLRAGRAELSYPASLLGPGPLRGGKPLSWSLRLSAFSVLL